MNTQEPMTFEQARIADLETINQGLRVRIEILEQRERACYEALGYDPSSTDKEALPYLIDRLIQDQNKVLAQRDTLISSLQAQLQQVMGERDAAQAGKLVSALNSRVNELVAEKDAVWAKLDQANAVGKQLVEALNGFLKEEFRHPVARIEQRLAQTAAAREALDAARKAGAE